MISWQRRARAGVALVGVLTAAGVYLTLGERRQQTARAETPGLPPRVVLESRGGEIDELTGVKHEYQVSFSRSLTYDDGTSKSFDVRIDKLDLEGRDFVVTAREGTSTRDNADVELRHAIRLREHDGFELSTEQATFRDASGLVEAPGAIAFRKGRMSGTGVGFTYDEPRDILHIARNARVEVAAEGDQKAVTFTAGSATLNRRANLLVLTTRVHVVHGDQITNADASTAYLSENEDLIQMVELRGHSQVQGGLARVSSIGARDIDLDYAADGRTIEQALLRGDGVIQMTGTEGGAGRRLEGAQLDIALRPDGSLDSVRGGSGVIMTIPPAGEAPARTIRSQTLDGRGAADGTLQSAEFAGGVNFAERAGAVDRTATSTSLTLELTDAAIGSALFTGAATFTDGDLRGTAATARYEPDTQRLQLRGRDERGLPVVTDPKMSIEAERIDVGLEAQQIDAAGRVKSVLRGDNERRGANTKAESSLPGLLQRDQPASIIAETLRYGAGDGTALYTGRAWLTQGDTEIRAREIEVQQKQGDLIARGDVRSTMAIQSSASGPSQGAADELRYTDSARTIVYSSGAAAPAGSLARLTGPQGDLRARRITLFLAAGESRLERLVAEDDVQARIDARTVTGQRLEYLATDERYHVTGTRAMPLTVEEECREMKGRALTFTRAADRMVIDGQGVRRTEMQRKPSCR